MGDLQIAIRKAFITFIILLACSNLYSQQSSEKVIAGFPDLVKIEAYSFKFDKLSGTYVYVSYDEPSQKYTVFSNKGNSTWYTSIMDNVTIIDGNGNYFLTAYNEVDSVYTYYIIKNGIEIASFDYIDASWKEKNGIIYFVCVENDVWFFAEYEISSGKFSKDKAYDEIFLVSWAEDIYEGEPIGEVGFTKDGMTYYLAELNNKKFLVIGGVEQKHYSDIEPYSVIEDNNGVLTYFAKDKGKFYDEKGNSFLVQGDKEYKKFDYLYMPIVFDKNNVPAYIAGDSSSSYIYPQRVVTGNDEGKVYTGGVSYLQFTPSGKLAYVASNLKDPEKSIYESFLVMDGKEGKKYNYIGFLNFLPDGSPLYSASFGSDRSAIIMGNKKIEADLPNVVDLCILKNGKIAYVESAYGNYEKKVKDRYIVHIGDNEFGPYDGMQFLYGEAGSYLISDEDGNYIFIASYLKDFKSYFYENVLFSNKGKSKKFDYFENVDLYKGKPLFVTSKMIDKVNYVYEYALFYDFKQIGSVYSSISDYKFDEKTGTITFIGTRGKDFYFVEVKL
jgi:hypothetical protein